MYSNNSEFSRVYDEFKYLETYRMHLVYIYIYIYIYIYQGGGISLKALSS